MRMFSAAGLFEGKRPCFLLLESLKVPQSTVYFAGVKGRKKWVIEGTALCHPFSLTAALCF